MSSQTMTAVTHGEASRGASLFSLFADWRAARARKAATRVLCGKLEAMDDRLLLDIGMSEVEIARLRCGDKFVPTRVLATAIGVSA